MQPDRAFEIFCALLARDALPAQRFTDLVTRIEQLAHVSCAAAEAFNRVEGEWKAPNSTARMEGQRLWDANVVVQAPVREVKTPKRAKAANDDEQREPMLFNDPWPE